MNGTWLGSSDGSLIELNTSTGSVSTPLHDLTKIIVGRDAASRSNPASNPPSPTVFYPADGGRLIGRLLGPSSKPDRVIGQTLLDKSHAMPFDRLAGVQWASAESFSRAYELFSAALAQRRAGEDVLVTRDADEAKALRGRLERLDAEDGSFVFGGRARAFKTDKMFGLVFAAGADAKPAEKYPVTIVLHDGSWFPGRVTGADTESIRIQTSLGIEANLPLRDVAIIKVHSNRVVYVSDLKPIDERIEGLLHRPWPVRMDRSTTGGPIVIDGRRFDKGIGVHSKTVLTFDIGGEYETFVAAIGLDDAVRSRGSVIFRVIGDHKVLFDSGVKTGRDPAEDATVKVEGVRVLSLVVDYGDEMDLADQANWGDARLLRPATGRDAGR